MDSSDLNKRYIVNIINKEKIKLIVFPTTLSEEKDYQLLLDIFKQLKLEMLLVDYNLSEGNRIKFVQRVKQALKVIPFLIYEPVNLFKYLIRKLLGVFS